MLDTTAWLVLGTSLAGLLLASAHTILNYRSIVSGAKKSSEAYVPPKKLVIVMPCKISSSTEAEIELALASVRSAILRGLANRAFIIVDQGEEIPGRLQHQDHRLVVLRSSAPCSRCSGKNRALVTALRSIRESGAREILFLDCDAYHGPGAVEASLKLLGERSIVTGYRWYLLDSISSALYNTISSIALDHMGFSRTRIAWGGFTLMLSEHVEMMRLETRWAEELSDDAVVTSEASRNGVEIAFCSRCISTSRAPEGIKGFIGWAIRQFLILRIYTPRGYRLLMAAYAANTFYMAALTAMAAAGLPNQACPAAVLLLYMALGAAKGLLHITIAKRAPRDVGLGERIGAEILYTLVVALRAPLVLAILAAAGLRRSFTWRGSRYCVQKHRGRAWAMPC